MISRYILTYNITHTHDIRHDLMLTHGFTHAHLHNDLKHAHAHSDVTHVHI